MDKLDEIFALQSMLNRNIKEKRNIEGYGSEKWIEKFALAMYIEMGEMLEETNYKWWKNEKEIDYEALKEEIVDVLHFFISICISSGMTAEELFQRYMDKNKENILRQEGKSSKKGYAVSEQECK